MKLLLTALLLTTGSFLFAQKNQTKTADPFAGLDTVFARVLKDRKAVGFAVAVVSKDKVIYSKGVGYRDLDKKLSVTPNTLFAIGSCSKAFTSSLLGILNKDGKIDFDKPVRDYLPDLKFFNDEMNNNITVRDIMCHRTGLPRHDFSWYLFNTPSKDSLVQRIKYQEPTAKLRETWQYNNFMFLVQGVISEKLMGKSWEQNVKENIFTPLGMTTSNFSVLDLPKSNDAALGYGVIKDSIIKQLDYYNINGMSPAGAINSSVNEMANWVITWINGGKFQSKEILPATYVTQAMSSQMVIAAGLPDKEIPDAFLSNYGFGWFISSYRGHYRVEHGGNIDGFSASTTFYPSDSIGIIVLTNQNGSAVPGIVRNTIADRLFNLNKIDWNKRANDAQAKAKAAVKDAESKTTSNKKQGTKLSHKINDYEGLFNNPGYGTIEIYSKDDSIFFRTRNGDAWLRHRHYDVFDLFPVDKKDGIDTTGGSQTTVQFNMNVAGDIDMLSMPIQPPLKNIEFNRIPKPREITKADLEKFVGEYELSPGAVAKFYIKGEKTLYAFIEGQPEYELVPTDKNKFEIKVLKGYSVKFEEDPKGQITFLSFIQPNGTFKAKRKNHD